MLITGVHFDFFFHQKKRNYQLGDYKNIYRQSQLLSGEIAKNKQTNKKTKNKKHTKCWVPTYPPPTPLGHLSVTVGLTLFDLIL